MSWEQLQAILDEQRQTAAAEKSRPPVACPNDGERLIYNAERGVWHCKFDGFQIVGGSPSGR